jgi:hypothetical protein
MVGGADASEGYDVHKIPKGPKTARFYEGLQDAPTDPGDVAAAAAYYVALVERKEADAARRRANSADPDCYDLAEQSNLRRLLIRWRKRVAGVDRRWNLAGARSGRLPVEQERQIRPPDPAWTEPLDKGK